jgi:hypothetical protein
MTPEEASVSRLPPLCPLLRLYGLCYGGRGRADCSEAQLRVDIIVIIVVCVELFRGFVSFEEGGPEPTSV